MSCNKNKYDHELILNPIYCTISRAIMRLDNIDFREIATKMFLQENQYKLAIKLNRKKLLGRKWDAGGGGRSLGWLFIEHNLAKITCRGGAGAVN